MYQFSKPIWDIAGATWLDHAPNPRFAVWSAGSLPQNDDVVLDRETGLVWERAPAVDKKAFGGAFVYSTTKVVARRKAWRLPTLVELLSLVDPSNANPTLPNGHPFLNLQLDYFYWSITRGIPVGGDPNVVWGYNFGNANTSTIVVTAAECYTWLVRGGSGYNYPL